MMLLSTVLVGAPVRIMPLGNSITKGTAGSDLDIGYRRKLYLDLVNAGYDINLLGTQIHGLVEDFDKDHEGHGGWEADEIRDNIYNWLVTNPADYVLLHIGTNDISHNHIDVSEVDQLLDNIDQFEADYGNPIKVLLARIIHRADGLNPKTIIFNDSVEALALDRILSGDDIVIVGMDTALTYPDDLIDNVHPNQTGYDKMATTWYNHLVEILPFGDCPDSMSHYWKLDESSGPIYYDSWATSDASCDDCPGAVDGVINGAQSFQPPEALDISSDESFGWSRDASFSIELWFRMDVCLDTDPDNRQVLIGRVGEGDALDRWWLAVNCSALYPAGRLEFYLADTSGGLLLVPSDAVVDGEWHHAIAVRDGILDSNVLYIDGAWAASGYVDYTGGFDALADINIGYLQDTSFSSYCTCYIDEIATYNRALSFAEAESHLNVGLLGYPYCEGSVAPGITSTPIEEMFEGQFYEYDVNATGDPDPVFRLEDYPLGMTIDSITGLIQWTVEPLGNYQVEVTAYNIAGVDTQSFSISVTSPPPCPPGLTHYWRFDELLGPTYYDFVGSANASGTLLDLTEGVVDGSQRFVRAEGDELNIFDYEDFDWGPESSFSIELWVKKETACETDDNGSNNIIISRYDGNPGTGDLNIWWIGFNCLSTEGTQGGIRFVLRDDSNTGVSLVGETDIIDGEWHHVVAIRDALINQNRVYIDGDLDASTSYTYIDGFADDSPVNIGYIAFGDHFGLDGYLDELALYSRVLRETEIIDHYMSGLNGIGVCPEFLCGDANGSGSVDIDDVVFLILFIFGGGPAPIPLISGDADCSGVSDIDDVVYLITWIFAGGPVPCHECPQ
jgi:lysophospholipase L1-like esterase